VIFTQLVKKLPTFYAHFRVHNGPTKNYILSQMNPVYTRLNTIFNTILTSTTRSSYCNLPFTFSYQFFIYSLYFSPLLCMLHAHPSYLPRFGQPNKVLLRKKYKLLRSLLCNFFQPPVFSSVLSSNVLIGTLFSNNPQSCIYSSLHVIKQVSCSYKTRDKILALYL
jgi:hypothetical protein